MRERKKQVGRQDFAHIPTVFIKFILKIAKFTCIFFFLNSLILEVGQFCRKVSNPNSCLSQNTNIPIFIEKFCSLFTIFT